MVMDDDDDDDEYLRVVMAKIRTAKRQAVKFDCTSFPFDVMERRLVEIYQRCKGSCCLYFREDRRMFSETSVHVYETAQRDIEKKPQSLKFMSKKVLFLIFGWPCIIV
jgi:hypothetical protein